MKRSNLALLLAAFLSFAFAVPPVGAQPAKPSAPKADEAAAPNKEPGQTCMSDIRDFDLQIEGEGYWLYGSGYGYPVYGYGYLYSHEETSTGDTEGQTGFRARPGYEVRTLITAAHILAEHGKEQACEAVLAMARDTYKGYKAELRERGVRRVDAPAWRRQQIAAAQPVASISTSFRSDQLVGTDVRNVQDEVLGSVDDIVLNPQTGKFAYLVIARGGIFGIGEKHVPVPWEDFKTTADITVLVLDTTKKAMDAAPRMDKDHFSPPGQFDEMSAKVDAYWTATLSK